MKHQFNDNCPINIEDIYNVFSNENNPGDNESIQISHLMNNEEQDSNCNNYFLNNNQNVEEDGNDNMEENAAPHISNNMDNINIDNAWLEESQAHDFSNFSLLNSSNICDIKQDSKVIEFTSINADNMYNDQNIEVVRDNICEKKEIHFQMGDFVTPLGDNDNIDNTNNNLNSINSSKNSNMETPGNNNLSNSSLSQITNKSSILSAPLSNNAPLNNSSNGKEEIICPTFCPKQEN